MATLVLAQHDNRQLEKATLHAVGAAAKLGSEVHLVVLGYEARGVAEAAAQVQGVTRVIHVEHPTYTNPLAEDVAQLLSALRVSMRR
jgi:electron transfer flavoprotein alpha subunit